MLVGTFQLRIFFDSVIRVWGQTVKWQSSFSTASTFHGQQLGRKAVYIFSSWSIYKWQLLLNTSLWVTKSLVSNLFSLEKGLTRWNFYFSCLRNNRYFKTSQLKIISVSSSSHPKKVKGTHMAYPGSERHVILIAWHTIDVTQKTSSGQLGNNLLLGKITS